MHALNPTMAAATFAEATIIQKPLIQGQLDDATLGTMTLERWRTLAEQLKDLGLIEGRSRKGPSTIRDRGSRRDGESGMAGTRRTCSSSSVASQSSAAGPGG